MNELGDFLAGAFAPLAFIWLAAAVFIQSQELKAQRTELTLTRREFKLNREVMKAQAEEARKQADFIGQQTEILRSEQKSREDEKLVREFDASLERLSARIKDNIACLSFTDSDRKLTPVKGDEMNEILLKSPTDKDLIRNISGIFSPYVFSKIEDSFREKQLILVDAPSFQNVRIACLQACSGLEELPIEAKITAEEIGLEHFKIVLEWIANKASNNSDT